MEREMVDGETLSAKWCEALLLEGESCLIESSVRELTEYFGIRRVDALESCVTAGLEAKREWEAEPRHTVHDVEAFYRMTRSCLFENLWSHATAPAENAANVALLAYAQQIGALEYLDFGGGVGSNAILFARAGFNVTVADISPPMLAFARWRLQRRGLSAQFIDLNRQSLPRNRYAFATAVDVLAHLYDPTVELQQLSEALVLNGVLAFNLQAGNEAECPMRILPASVPVFRALRNLGLRGIQGHDPVGETLRAREFYTARRIAQSRVRDWSYRAYDLVFSGARMQEWWGRVHQH
jgi:SAM-dependent methyltransferase